jgi:hypothetical protein
MFEDPDTDPHHFGNLNSHPHQIKYQSEKLDPEPDPNPHQFADDKTKSMEMRLF